MRLRCSRYRDTNARKECKRKRSAHVVKKITAPALPKGALSPYMVRARLVPVTLFTMNESPDWDGFPNTE